MITGIGKERVKTDVVRLLSVGKELLKWLLLNGMDILSSF